MYGRYLSVFALVGSLTTLVLVATFAGAGDANPPSSVSPRVACQAAPAWTRFRVRPALLFSEGALSEGPLGGPVVASAPQGPPRPASLAIYRYVREQTGKGRVVLASYER